VAHPPQKGKWRQRRGKEQPKNSDDLASRLVTILDPLGAASEAYRTLRTNLFYTLVDDPPKVIVLTSYGPREGKSTVCANLGVVLAQAGKDTVILDCDFRKPTMHKFFGIRNIRGIVDILVGSVGVQEVWAEGVEGLKVAPAGPIPPNPSELLGTQRFSALLADMRRSFDYVLVDAPPIGWVSDPAILAAQGDGVLLVLDAQNTRKRSVQLAMRSLESVGTNVLGTVMNNVKVDNDRYYTYP
jgi:receptor protein-tyrosine kinase